MKNEESNFTNDEFIVQVSLEQLLKNDNYKKSLEEKSYENYLRKRYGESMVKSMTINYKVLEEIFSDELSYAAMKELPESEKFAIYVIAFRKEYLDRLCNENHISKKGFYKIYKNGTNRFKKNMSKYAKNGYKYKVRSDYKKKGGVFNG